MVVYKHMSLELFNFGQTKIAKISCIYSHFIFVTTITTAGCVKKSVKCKIFRRVYERKCLEYNLLQFAIIHMV